MLNTPQLGQQKPATQPPDKPGLQQVKAVAPRPPEQTTPKNSFQSVAIQTTPEVAPAKPYTPSNNVANNLNQLVNSDSTYMQQARQKGLNAAASRGLLNSSIASGASQAAAIRAAAPIASQDAGIQQQQWNTEKSVQANLQGRYTKAIDSIMKNTSININEIETAKGLNQAQKNQMIRNSLARRDADLRFLKKMYSAMPTWANNWTKFPAMPGAPGVK